MAGANSDQADFWTHQAGPTWVTHQAALDQLLAPVSDRVLSYGALAAGHSVLDIGCGTGALSVQAAELVGAKGQIVGADISTTMVAQAARRSSGINNVRIVLGDVAEYRFGPDAFDRLISRFGVMFFADPAAALHHVAAFLKLGGRICFATWGQIPANPWFTLPAQVAKAELGAPPKSDPDAPGPFSMRDIDQTSALLRAAGFADVTGVCEDLRLSLPEGADAVAALSLHVGPAAGTIRHFNADAPAIARIKSGMAEGFAAFGPQGIPAEINFFTATKG